MKLNNCAVLVIDMLNDFVTGKLKCERANNIIPNINKLVKYSRKSNIPVIYCNDAHIKGIDKELKLWGDHAIVGSYGAQVIDELKPSKNDFIVNKRRYSSFFQTDLDILLKELSIKTVILTGLHANMCIRHTAADAFQLGYDIIVLKDGVECFSEHEYLEAIDYLKKVYGAKIINVNNIVK